MIRIPMEMAYNVRDLGGYYAKNNMVTKNGKFLRAGGITALTETDISKLIGYGVKTVIDLRSEEEIDEKPNTFAHHETVKYYHIGLLDELDEKLYPLKTGETDFLGELYIVMLDNCKHNIMQVFKTFAHSMDNCTLFHCTAGKDRTGIIAAILLDMAGVDYYDIIANYEVTYTYIKKRLSEIIGDSPEDHARIGLSNPQSIEMFLKYLYAEYGGAEQYLKHIKISNEEINTIKNNFVSVI